MTFDELEAFRKKMKMNQKRMAHAIGVSYSTYHKYRHRPIPKPIAIIVRMADHDRMMQKWFRRGEFTNDL